MTGDTMIRKNQKQLNRLNAVTDGVLVLLSYLFASWLWLDVVKGDPNIAAVNGLQSAMTAVIYALWTVLVLTCFRMYRMTRLSRMGHGLKNIILANAIALVSAAALLYLFRLQEFSRGVLAVF